MRVMTQVMGLGGIMQPALTLEQVAAFSRADAQPLRQPFRMVSVSDIERFNKPRPITSRDIKRIPLVAEMRHNVAVNLVDCRRTSTKMARVARDQLKAICRARNLLVW